MGLCPIEPVSVRMWKGNHLPHTSIKLQQLGIKTAAMDLHSYGELRFAANRNSPKKQAARQSGLVNVNVYSAPHQKFVHSSNPSLKYALLGSKAVLCDNRHRKREKGSLMVAL